MLNNSTESNLGLQGAPPERTIYLALFRASGIHRVDRRLGHSFGRPDPQDPCRWRPVWDRIAARLDCDAAILVSDIIDDLAKPPYGLRAGPALLVIGAFLIASNDCIALMERNSFQPDWTIAHLVRLAKTPKNFALRTLRERPAQKGPSGGPREGAARDRVMRADHCGRC